MAYLFIYAFSQPLYRVFANFDQPIGSWLFGGPAKMNISHNPDVLSQRHTVANITVAWAFHLYSYKLELLFNCEFEQERDWVVLFVNRGEIKTILTSLVCQKVDEKSLLELETSHDCQDDSLPVL